MENHLAENHHEYDLTVADQCLTVDRTESILQLKTSPYPNGAVKEKGVTLTRTVARRPALLLAALATAAVAALAVHPGMVAHPRADSIWTPDTVQPTPSPSSSAGAVAPDDSIWTAG